MERKGSGFGKILNGYKAQINYTEDKRPAFRSDRYQFTVVMPNLNYVVPQDVPQCVPQDVPQDDLDAKILALIKKDNKISTEKLGMALGRQLQNHPPPYQGDGKCPLHRPRLQRALES